MSDIAKYWMYDKFATNIYYVACAIRNGSRCYKNSEVFALTSQKSDFDKLNSDDLLGVIHTSSPEEGLAFIEHFQVNPKYIYKIVPEYKGIGTGILNSLKLLYDSISCYPANEDYILNFYERNGFVKQPNTFNYYVYNKKH